MKSGRQSKNIEDKRGYTPTGPLTRTNENSWNNYVNSELEAIRAKPRQVETATKLGLSDSVRGMDKKPRLKKKGK